MISGHFASFEKCRSEYWDGNQVWQTAPMVTLWQALPLSPKQHLAVLLIAELDFSYLDRKSQFIKNATVLCFVCSRSIFLRNFDVCKHVNICR